MEWYWYCGGSSMIQLNYRELIRESEEELLTLERRQTQGILRLRVRFLRLLKSGECPTQAQAGERIALGPRQSQRLWQRYRQGGLKLLLAYPYQGHKPRLTPEQQQALQQELKKDQIHSLQQACAWLWDHQGVRFSPSGVHYLFKRLRVKKKTGRPVHHHRDSAGAEAFKKKPARPRGAL